MLPKYDYICVFIHIDNIVIRDIELADIFGIFVEEIIVAGGGKGSGVVQEGKFERNARVE